MTVVLNGKVVDEIDLTTLKDGEITPDGSAMPKRLPGKQWSKMPLKDRIGFNCRRADAGIEFRKVKLLQLGSR